MSTKPSLPLVRLSLIRPIVNELDRSEKSTSALLAANGLTRETLLDREVFVPPIVVHRFLEDAARAAGDPHLCCRVGESLDHAAWPPLMDAVARANTLGEFLIRFIRAAKDEASSARHTLEVGAAFATFREIRTSEQEIAPAQNDAFTAAYVLDLLRRGAGAAWRSGDVHLTVCDPTALPVRYLGVHIASGDRRGIRVRFPTPWLVQPLERRGFIETESEGRDSSEFPTRFVDSLRRVLEPHLHSPDLGVDTVVKMLGTSRQSLQRKLRANGTTLSDEIRALKKKRALESLSETDRGITEIAGSLGFHNPTSFSRAFKSWTGFSPRDYRKNRRAD